jgi:prophage DNA circulation protein
MARQKWKDKLRPASYRGVKFYIDTTNYQSGRRGQTHEFPGRDKPFREDLGRKARKYPIEGYLVGGAYLADKKKLIDALEKEGPGDLVHPYYARVRVSVDDFTVYESASEGGYVKISINFVESGELQFPNSSADGASLVGAAGDLLNAAASGDLANKFSILDQPQFVIDSAVEKVEAFCDTVNGFVDLATGTAQQIADLAFSIRRLKADIRDLLGTPALLYDRMKSAVGFLTGALDPSDIVKSAKSMFNFGGDDVVFNRSTPTREQQYQNNQALNYAMRVQMTEISARAAVDMDHASVDDANLIRDAIGDQLDTLMEEATDDDVFSSLQDLRAQVVNAVPPKDESLARVARVTPVGPTNSLALAYELYGSLSLEDDLVGRNGIRNPGFIPGGKELEVLDRA